MTEILESHRLILPSDVEDAGIRGWRVRSIWDTGLRHCWHPCTTDSWPVRENWQWGSWRGLLRLMVFGFID